MIENIHPTDERAFEKSIELALVGSTRESRKTAGLMDIDGQCPNFAQYYWGCPTDLDKRTALDVRRLWHFLNRSQADVLAEYKGSTGLRMAQTAQATPEYTRLTHVGFTQAAESGAMYKAK